MSGGDAPGPREPGRRWGPPRLAAVLAAAAVLAVEGCAPAQALRGTRNPFGNDDPGSAEVRIRVVNFNFSDATVWTVIRNGRRQRLGTVTGKADATFDVPWTFTEPLRLEFHLLAGPRCFTEELSVDPGDIIELQISVDPDADPMCRR